MRVVRLLADRGRSLEADEEQDAEQHAAEHASAGEVEEDVSLGLNTESETPSAPPFAMITIARISIGTNESARRT